MAGRFGTHADVILHASAMDSILSAADMMLSDDIRVRVYLDGIRGSDPNGAFIEVTGILPSSKDAVGMAITSGEPGTEPSSDDIGMMSEISAGGVMIVIDPYSGEFSVYTVENGVLKNASAVMLE